MGKLEVIDTPLEGVKLIKAFRADDVRGTFVKPADSELLQEIGFGVREIFLSVNRKNVIRGLHYIEPGPQRRIVFCIQGEILDVAADIRPSSPNFGKWHAEALTGKNCTGMLVPRGFAHGFMSLSDESIVLYLADEKHVPENDRGIRYDDPDIGIKWPLGSSQPIMSKRDLGFPTLKKAAELME